MGLAGKIETQQARLAERLKGLRTEHGLSLEALAAVSGVSRATLSRLETGQTSPTAAQLGMICAAYGITLSRLMHLVEGASPALVRAADQPRWRDEALGFDRTMVSPPAPDLAGEVLRCVLAPGAVVDYPAPPRLGLEHHLLLLEGALDLTVEGTLYALRPGDCLRYRLSGASAFRAGPDGARYFLFMV